ncbi:galactan 5-O-arabinofuranosyltransferase [Corynebacterium lizhenjunii]|uniref:Galactan 5-O-arabinofuranosyltransferase n=1 Tax=Corynebacterium lizhenjunii TaxID=2709394 RepID=A0A7T0KEC6_9CORY|nr:galactan 5-O-arabinofuranosyltransferase [Corynebacterium lizhenjunii]QPK79253.1 galactan 5-O-arabinofuranosyltransferase [Corynebacterium lizhenjunii]
MKYPAKTQRHPDVLRPQLRTETYATDLLPLRSTLLGIVSAATSACVVTLGAWWVLKQTSLPAFNTSMVTRGLATVGIVGTVVVTAALLAWWIFDEYRQHGEPIRRPTWRTGLTYLVSYLAPALLVIASIGIPLSATRLWLDGVQVDQVFRTQFLTRTTEQGGYADMNYLDMPTFYPLGWFWLGGRLAAVLGLPGWEVFQPWSLVSLAVAGSVLVPVWQHLVGSLPVATAIAVTTTAATLSLGAEEPYSAVIAMGMPAAVVVSARAFQGSWAATVGLILYLGVSATFYTLYTGVIALTVVSLLAVVTAVYERKWGPVLRLVLVGVSSLAIAALAWGPYVLAALRADAPLESAAQHYLPSEGTQIPAPFLSPTIVGVLCLIGIVYLVLRWADPDVRALMWALGGVYLWIIASMAVTLVGSTLLGFRLEILVVLLLATAGVLALAEIRLVGVHVLYPARFDVPTNRAITAAFVVVLSLAGISYAQQIPRINEDALDNAYADTDGYGERADRFAAGAASYYQEIADTITRQGYVPNQTVVMTDEKLFMAYHPFHGFNGFTSHYANPLGEFSARNEAMEDWALHSWVDTPQEFRQRLDEARWKAPDAIIFRGTLPEKGNEAEHEGFKIHIAEDIFPNQPNVRYRAIFYDPQVFSQGWELSQHGPFVVAVRTAT